MPQAWSERLFWEALRLKISNCLRNIRTSPKLDAYASRIDLKHWSIENVSFVYSTSIIFSVFFRGGTWLPLAVGRSLPPPQTDGWFRQFSGSPCHLHAENLICLIAGHEAGGDRRRLARRAQYTVHKPVPDVVSVNAEHSSQTKTYRRKLKTKLSWKQIHRLCSHLIGSIPSEAQVLILAAD